MRRSSGSVSFIGVGPGSADLLTVRAAAILRACKAAVYPAGIPAAILALLPPSCEKHEIREERTEDESEAVHRLLDQLSRDHNCVSRLVLGDPYLGGLAFEEVLFCQGNNIPWDAIPGVPVFTSAAALSGVPLFHSILSDSVLVLRGPYSPIEHTRPNAANAAATAERRPGINVRRRPKMPEPRMSETRLVRLAPSASSIIDVSEGQADHPSITSSSHGYEPVPRQAGAMDRDWRAISHSADTLVFLDAGQSLPAIREGLLSGGRAGADAALLTRACGTPRQQTTLSTLDHMVVDFPPASAGAKESILFIGDTVSLRDLLSFYEASPLFGLRVGIISVYDEHMGSMLQRAGAQPIFFPVIERIETPGLAETIPYFLDDLSTATDLIFTDEFAVELFLSGLNTASLDVRVISAYATIVACGVEAELRLRQAGLQALLASTAYARDHEQLLRLYPQNLENRRVILIESEEGLKGVANILRERGANVLALAVYEDAVHTHAAEALREALDVRAIDVLAIRAPRALDAIRRVWGDDDVHAALRHTKIAAIGSATAEALRTFRLPPAMSMENATPETLINSLVRWKSGRNDGTDAPLKG
ncbi:hypothetical protein BH09SUM1_BH09SUM1_30540 [soil metagenome]